jgi:hypothetical protein
MRKRSYGEGGSKCQIDYCKMLKKMKTKEETLEVPSPNMPMVEDKTRNRPNIVAPVAKYSEGREWNKLSTNIGLPPIFSYPHSHQLPHSPSTPQPEDPTQNTGKPDSQQGYPNGNWGEYTPSLSYTKAYDQTPPTLPTQESLSSNTSINSLNSLNCNNSMHPLNMHSATYKPSNGMNLINGMNSMGNSREIANDDETRTQLSYGLTQTEWDNASMESFPVQPTPPSVRINFQTLNKRQTKLLSKVNRNNERVCAKNTDKNRLSGNKKLIYLSKQVLNIIRREKQTTGTNVSAFLLL